MAMRGLQRQIDAGKTPFSVSLRGVGLRTVLASTDYDSAQC